MKIANWITPTYLTIKYVPADALEASGHIESVKILVILNPTGYMLTSSSSAAFIHWRYVLYIPLKWTVNFPKSWTLTGHFSNSTGSSATHRRFFPDIGVESSCNRWKSWRRMKKTNRITPTYQSPSYIGCPCPWVLGGHECDIIVHGWACRARFCASLHPTPNRSQTYGMQGIR